MVKRFVFHHINKCAGTTLLYALQDKFDHDDCVFMERYSERLDFDQYDYPEYEEISRARFIHEPSGTRNWKSILPNISTFAMFRDPIDRVYSQWMMIAKWTDEESRNDGRYNIMRETALAGFEQFMTSEDPRVILDRWNSMTAYLLMGDRDISERWVALEGVYNADFAREALDLAIANLEAIDLIGLVEAFDDSYDALGIAFPFVPDGPLQSHNVRGTGGYRRSLDQSARAAAEGSNTLDEVVYAAARNLFSKQMERLAAEFGGDLKAAALQRYEQSLIDAPEWAIVSMGGRLHGFGWHAREVNGAKLSRWIGPRPIATIDVPLKKKGDVFVRARCTAFIDPNQLTAFKMSADGVPLQLTTWVHLDRYRYFEGVISANELRPDSLLRVELDCGFVQLSGNPDDPRELGLEFSEIEVGPASGFCPGAPGTPVRSRI